MRRRSLAPWASAMILAVQVPSPTLAADQGLEAEPAVEVARDSGPTAVSPGDLREFALVGDSCPTFSWTPVGGADRYEVVIYEVRTPRDAEVDLIDPPVQVKVAGGASSWSASGAHCAAAGRRYAWAVRSITGAGPSPWSSPLLFAVEDSAGVEAELRQIIEEVLDHRNGGAGADGSTSSDARGGEPEARSGRSAAPTDAASEIGEKTGGPGFAVDGAGSVVARAFILDCDTADRFFRDQDQDTFGDPDTFARACAAPGGWVTNGSDCNDQDSSIKPGADELCDGGDNDCDGTIDEGCSLGSPCSNDSQCSSAFCVDGYCCDSACSGSCDQCNLSGSLGSCTLASAGSSGSPSCSPYLCNGASATCPTSCTVDGDCVSTRFCSGGTCVAKKANGGTCSSSNQCESGFCVDGYCCNSACSGACDQCNLSGALGSCTLAPAGSSGSPSCSPHLCDGASATCPTSCTVDGNCAPDHFCSGGTCVAKNVNGSVCSSSSECASGFCVDGYCCGSACSAPCDLCDLSGAEGTCSLAPAGWNDDESCTPYVCSGASATCPAGCTTDADCASGYVCDGGACTSP